jgi:ankyrin repeat protein
VVKLLLVTDKVDVDFKDTECGRTPLSWAAEGGHEAVVKLLLAIERSTSTPGTLSLVGRLYHWPPREGTRLLLGFFNLPSPHYENSSSCTSRRVWYLYCPYLCDNERRLAVAVA